jgi:amino acid adenylation domain-containing protein
VGARDDVEARLVGLWEELLGVAGVGVADDFFALGGTSLQVMELITGVRERFDVELSGAAVYDQPTLAGLAQAIRAALGEAPARGVAHARSGPAPVSFAQRRLWFLERLQPGSTAYNVPIAVTMRGASDPACLEEALTEVVRRHAALRTSLPDASGEPVQVVHPAEAVRIPLDDLSELPPRERRLRLDELSATHARLLFDLVDGPLWRARLVRLDAREHVLLLVIHHTVVDGRSVHLLLSELCELLDAGTDGRRPRLPELVIDYPDFCAWQREHHSAAALPDDVAYWRGHLAGAPGVLEMPTDRPRPPQPSTQGATQTRTIGPELGQAFDRLCRAHGATPFMGGLALYALLLARYAQTEDLVVGVPVSGRTRPDTQALIGMFVNTLPVRVDLAGNRTFSELLERVRVAALGALAHQDLPLDQLIEELRPTRSVAHTPLFQVSFTFEDAHRERYETSACQLELEVLDNGGARFELGLAVAPSDDGLRLVLDYREELWDGDSIRRMLAHYEGLLRGVVADPDRPIRYVPMLGADELRTMLVGWNDTAGPYPDRSCVHELVTRQAQATPDAPAIAFGGADYSYETVEARANQLAHHLQALGIGPESRVAVFMERSVEMVVGVLAVLKAGGGYVPIDPTYPRERVAFMLADSSAEVVLTQPRLAQRLPHGTGAVVELDAGAQRFSHLPSAPPPQRALPANLAYMIYTSGSTGRPKGTLVTHRSVCNFVTTVRELFSIGPHDNVLQFASLSFDVSVFEIFGALTNGARLCVPTEAARLSMTDLEAFMEAHRITIVDIPPAVMTLLPGGAFPALRVAFVGGEAFSGGLVNRWSVPGRRFYNGYGPTESTVTVIVEECRAAGDYDSPPPIGRPMRNHRAYVLDRWLEPVPIGVPGELFIGGAGLTRGYHGRPGLSAERFLPDPVVFGERMYRSGDLVRYLPDGRMEFLGRCDDQVKLRGFRVEPAEIEAVLEGHPDVAEAAVAVREDTPGVKRLVAYVVAHADRPSARALRAHVAEKLPPYMVPAAFVTLPSFPLSPSGKVDRTALPPPGRESYASATRRQAPRNRRERALAELFARLLGVEEVSVDDDFFELGGHSILAVQLVWGARQAFGVEVPLVTVFERPTIEALAVAVEEAMLQTAEAVALAAPARVQEHLS